jgi:hypothetical protein
MKLKKSPLIISGLGRIVFASLLLLLNLNTTSAQNQKKKEETVWLIASELPNFQYKSGSSMYESFALYVQDSLRLPAADCRGKVLVSFVVEKDSTISRVQIRQGLDDCPGHEEEVRRLLLSMPPWVPGKNNGETVKVCMRMPIIFQ